VGSDMVAVAKRSDMTTAGKRVLWSATKQTNVNTYHAILLSYSNGLALHRPFQPSMHRPIDALSASVVSTPSTSTHAVVREGWLLKKRRKKMQGPFLTAAAV
jgi:hypothetical protein